MKYHAKLYYGENNTSYWANWRKERIIEKLIIPFINGQVVFHQSPRGKKAILNLRNVSELKIYRTEENNIGGIKIGSQIMMTPEFEEYDCTEEIINETKIDLSAANTQSLLQKAFAKQEDQVFVIMKFGDKILDSAYTEVVKPLFLEFGVNVIRVDEIQNSGNISDQILEQIAKSKFIYSDLSGERPNCYYETGFAHALGKEIILSINSKYKVHFDLSGHRFIQWETEGELRKFLKKRIQALLGIG